MIDNSGKRNSSVASTLFWPMALLLCVVVLALGTPGSIARFYLYRQDLPLIGLAAALGAAACFRLPTDVVPLARSGRWVAALCALAVVVTYGGHHLLLEGYDLSRDEQMATFDARIFASGRIVWPIAPQWSDIVQSFNTKFMPALQEPAAWASSYLPGNAALRAGVSLFADPGLTGPLMTGAAIALSWLCARRLWPDDRETAIITTLLVALSGQVLMGGMTAYAMPAHLAFNMLWLWLFLHDRRGTDVAALAAGFIATGLHQPIFHPMFVAPWLALLMIQRDWRRLALFLVGYGVICLFWLAWPSWQVQAMGGVPIPMANGTTLLSHLGGIVTENEYPGLLMSANLVRFVAWQPIALIPLCAIGLICAKGDKVVLALAGGVFLTLIVVAVLMALQGHGFGYRYLHGLIGNTTLIAGFGWRSLGDAKPQARVWLRRSLIAGALILLPLQALFGHESYAPFADASKRFANSRADFVIIGAHDAPYSDDLVLNQPGLDNHPLRLLVSDDRSSATLARRICRTPAVVGLPGNLFYREIDSLFAVTPSNAPDRRIALLTPILTGAGCTIKVID